MPPLFPPWANSVVRVAGACLLAGPLATVCLLLLYVRSPLFTGAGTAVEQPVLFDHRHHVGDDRIDCRYCHSSVEISPSAGYPSTEVCLGCHGQLWTAAPLLQPVRESWFQGRPIRWNRVYRLPDFVYFDHSAHVAKGIGCVSCHGIVQNQPLIAQASSLTMKWCLDCHRDPVPRLRPREALTAPIADEGAPWARQRAELAKTLGVHARTSCTTCHR